MARLGYKCDKCGEKHRNMDPAAYVNGMELCSGCYDDYYEEKHD